MKYTQKIVFIVALFLVIFSCSTRKDTFVNRNYHALTTKFNVLFNGKEAFNEGIEAINNNYKDNWFKQLPIEPIDFEEGKIIISTKNSGIGAGFDDTEEEEKAITPFSIAEEKAVKAIQKHSMNINGLEQNTQIDEAYLLLGKARYYEQRFIPAIEAFDYVIANYPTASLIKETKIWKAKANLKIGNEDFAIESMRLLLDIKDSLEIDSSKDIKEHGYTALAMAYVKSDSIQNAKKALFKATETIKNKEQGVRNLFVLGQIYSSENKKDSASIIFNKIINFRRAPCKYQIHANIELAKNSTTDSTATLLLKNMCKLIKDRDNRPYLDELYYQMGYLHEKNDSLDLALDYYEKSLKANAGSDTQKTYTYERIGNINFKNSKYQLASSSYENVLSIAKDSLSLRIRRVKRKHKSLASLINFEKTVAKNDSIIKLASFSTKEQQAFFKKYIDNLKKKDKDAAQLKLNQQAFGANFGSSSLKSNKKGNWYFYNSQSLNFGKTEFVKIWGNRKLEDNWRWTSKFATNKTENNSLQANQKNPRYDLTSYLQTIPASKNKIDSLKLERNEALLELGIIYKEQFKDFKLAIERLEKVASLNPSKELKLPINWHLYKIYKNLGEKNKKNKYKDIILKEYPNSVFAKTIKYPNKAVLEEVSVNEIENKYKEIYYLYKQNKFKETAEKVIDILPTLKNSKLIPKFELLKAYAIGKYVDKKTYKSALETIIIKYGGTEEGKKAKQIVNQLN